uniref:GH3 domain containing n=1 Tax=Gopherus evgoodei TaxID=1825980 RepID=A0A8C4W453_9SAUR
MLLAGLAVALALLLWAWQRRPGGAGSWGLVLRHWLALRVLGWAAGWQRWHLEQASQDVRQSQERLLLRLLGGARAAEPGTGAGGARRWARVPAPGPPAPCGQRRARRGGLGLPPPSTAWGAQPDPGVFSLQARPRSGCVAPWQSAAPTGARPLPTRHCRRGPGLCFGAAAPRTPPCRYLGAAGQVLQTRASPSPLGLGGPQQGARPPPMCTQPCCTNLGLSQRGLGEAGPVLYLDVLSRVFPEALSLQGTARFSWAGGCSQPAAAWALPTLYCTPEETGTVPSHTAALYVQLLFALRERALRALEAGLVSELYDALGVLRVGWEGLAQDLASGRLTRAAELRAECARGWDGVARRLWPRLQVVVVVAEPSSEQIYGEALREQECQGLPFYCPFYSAAGALLGVNLWPEQPDSRYLLCPGWAFCEFLPAGPGAEAPPETVLLADMQEGQEYELVLTDQAGLSRCPLSCHPHIPPIPTLTPCPWLPRLSQTLSVRGEGVPEERFYGSLRRAVAMWPGARLVDYICAESRLRLALVFVELRGLRDLSEAQRYKVRGFSYLQTFRFKGSIGPVRLHLVAAGAFRELRDAAGSPGPWPES